MPPWPVVLGSDALILGPVATNGKFLCSVKVITAIMTPIAAMMAMMLPMPHSRGRRRVHSRSLSSWLLLVAHVQLRSSVPRVARRWLETWPRLLAWVAQPPMQFPEQLRDPLGHSFGNLGSCGQLAGDSCLDFFDNQVLARGMQGLSCAVSTGHASTPGASNVCGNAGHIAFSFRNGTPARLILWAL
jgi:hypothetical protein